MFVTMLKARLPCHGWLQEGNQVENPNESLVVKKRYFASSKEPANKAELLCASEAFSSQAKGVP